MASQIVNASLAAALPVAIAHALIYGPIFGVIAIPIAAGFAFMLAICFAPAFLALRKRIPEPFYFLIHLVSGYAFGVVYSFLDSEANTTIEIFTGRDVALPLIASMSAWVYLYLFDTEYRANKRPDSFSLVWTVPLFTALVVGLGFIPKSRPYSENEECHNVLRGQRSSISPVERIRLTLPPEDEAKLKRYYSEFARRHHLQTKGHAIHTTSAQTSMCNESVTISAGGFFDGRHGIGVYELEPDSEWQTLTEDLVCGLKEVWPGSLQFGDGRGVRHDTPRHLKAHCYSDQ